MRIYIRDMFIMVGVGEFDYFLLGYLFGILDILIIWGINIIIDLNI